MYNDVVDAPDSILVATDRTYSALTSRRWWGGRVVSPEDLPTRLTPDAARSKYAFDIGHPVDGTVYVANPCVAGHYLLPALANERLASEKLAAFQHIAAGLGARTIELMSCECEETEHTGSASTSWVAAQLGGVGSRGTQSSSTRRMFLELAAATSTAFNRQAFQSWLQIDPGLRRLVDIVEEHRPLRYEVSLEIRDMSEVAGRLSLALGSRGINVGGKIRSVGHSRWTFAITFFERHRAVSPATPMTDAPLHLTPQATPTHVVLRDIPRSEPARQGIPFDEFAQRLEAWNVEVSYEAAANFIKVEGPGGRIYLEKRDPVARIDLSDFAIPAHQAIRRMTREEAVAQHLGRVRGQLDFAQPQSMVLEAFEIALGIISRERNVEEDFFVTLGLKTSPEQSAELERVLRALKDELGLEVDLGREYLLLQTRAIDGKKPRTILSFSKTGRVQGQGDLPKAMVSRHRAPEPAIAFLQQLQATGCGLAFVLNPASGIYGYPTATIDAVLTKWPAVADAIRSFIATLSR